MKLKSIRTNPKNIVFTALYNSESDSVEAEEERKVTCQEMPTPEFDQALQALIDPALEVLNLPGNYRDSMVVTGFALSETKNGTRSMEIFFKKELDKTDGTPHRMDTPLFRIEEPADGDSGSMHISKANAKACHHAINEAKSYAMGSRAQMTFTEHLDELKEKFAEAEAEEVLI